MDSNIIYIHGIPVIQQNNTVDTVKLSYQRYKIIKKSILGISIFFGIFGICKILMT
jgi:hypothetical protein